MFKRKIFAALGCLSLLLACTSGASGVGASRDDGISRVLAEQRRHNKRKAKKKMTRPTQEKRVPEGTWGGPHVRLQVNASGGEVEFDCAHGEISAALTIDAEGRFDAPGTFVREGGPIRVGRERAGRAARYSGRVEGQTMTLTVRLTDTDQTLDTFTLTRNSEGRLWKCL